MLSQWKGGISFISLWVIDTSKFKLICRWDFEDFNPGSELHGGRRITRTGKSVTYELFLPYKGSPRNSLNKQVFKCYLVTFIMWKEQIWTKVPFFSTDAPLMILVWELSSLITSNITFGQSVSFQDFWLSGDTEILQNFLI